MAQAAANHPAQLRWHNSRARFNVAAAGRRSYKTERAKRKLIRGDRHHKGALQIPESQFFFAAPTREQAKLIAWRDLKDLTQPFWSVKPNETSLIISLINAAQIYVVGLDEPARVEGKIWHGGILDEYGNMKSDVWTHIQPITADSDAWIDFIGVPEGLNHYYELCENAKIWDDWEFHTWISADILTPKAMAEARKSLDPRAYEQEYEAKFVGSSINAYYTWTMQNVVDWEFDANADSFLCWDFNAGEKPMSTTLVQKINGVFVVTMEWVNAFTNTEAQSELIARWLRENIFVGSLDIVGDYAGRRRESNASFSDYEIITSHLKNYNGFRVATRPTLSVKDRVQSLNRMILNADGGRNFYVNRKCVHTIDDLQKASWKSNGVQLDESNPKRTHITDGLSYFAYNYYPIDVESRTQNEGAA